MCPRCGYSTDKKTNIKRHINKSTLCVKILRDVIPKKMEDSILSCDYSSVFMEMSQEIEFLKKKLETTQNLTQIENQTNNHIDTVNIIVNPYKNSNLEHLTDKDFKYCIDRMIMSVPSLIKKIHFNPKHPENHNICISNIKDTYGMAFDGIKWNICDRNDLIEDLLDKYEYKLEEWLSNGGKEHPFEMKKFEEYLEKKELDGVLDKIKQEIKFMLYNNRDMVKT